jgi:putative ABC transport system substrate-binding protein
MVLLRILGDTTMKRYTIGLLVTVVLSLLVGPLAAAVAPPRAQPARIAFLGLTPASPASALPPVVAGFQQGLRELGWVEGQNLTIEWRWAEGSLDRFTTLVDEVVRLPVEAIVVPNSTAARIAKNATSTIPIVVVSGGALATTDLITSLARPGGNVTGMSTFGPELATKRLELLTHVIPGLTRVAVLRGLSPSTPALQALEVAAQAGVCSGYV